MNKRDTGQHYEEMAVNHLIQAGYKILKRNYYTRYGEIDIIAFKASTYIFIEVKYRTSDKKGKPYEAVGHTKRQRLMKSSLSYCKVMNLFGQPMRFDIIDILEEKLTHYENAFEMDKRYVNY
ncbi:MAG: YraN family protein [Firmicutes bacterium HGW-Firmicutes-3]|jgi:putative endonuclease|nr:MAG: YraN family protein [Firmicutes bacterium HGW-Firmicutes-3]